MAERSIKVIVRAEISDFKRKLNEASDAARKLSNEQKGYIQKNKDSINELSTGVGIVGAALTGVAALAVTKFVAFDKSISAVAAATHESASNMDLLRQAALDAGQRTVFSATESAGAIEELAKAGLSTADILGGALDGSLDLAAAGALDVADAAGYMSVALAQFHLDGQQAAHVADLLAAGAGKAMGDVSDLGMALKQGGLVAAQTGLSIEETTAALSAFAKAGLLGSDAGTSLKTMLQRLTPQSDEAQAKFDELGISAYDARGNFVGLTDFAGQLQDKLGSLTPQARNAALSVMFGSDAVRAASVLYDEGADGIQKWIEAVDDTGYASETAATRLDNLAGDWEQLTGALETAFIGMGEGANGPLRELTGGATDVVNAFSGLPDAVKQGTLGIVGGGGLVLLGVAGMGKLVVSISSARDAMGKLGMSAKTAGGLVGIAGAAIGVATIAISAWAQASAEADASVRAIQDTLDKATGAVSENTREIVANELTARHGWWIFKKDAASDSARALGISLGDVTDAILGNADAMQRVQSVTRVYGPEAIKLADQLGISTSDLARHQLTLETEIKDYSEKFLPQAQANQRSLNEVVADGGDAAQQAAGGVEELTAAQQAEAQASEEATKQLEKWRQMVSDADASFIDLAGLYQGLVDKQREQAEGAAESAGKSADAWEDFAGRFAITADQYIADLQAQVDAQSAWEQNIIDISGRVRDGLTGDMRTAAEQMIDELIQLGPEGAQQVQLLHDMTDEQFKTVVQLWSQRGTDAVSEFTSKVESYRQPLITPGVDLSPADKAVQDWIQYQRVATITIRATMPDLNGSASGSGRMGTSAEGGPITGGVPGIDSVPILAMPGEWVLRKSSVDSLERSRPGLVSNLNRMGAAALNGYASGGPVGYSARYAMPVWSSPSVAAPAGARTEVHAPIYVSSSDPVSAGIEGARYVQRLVT